MNQAFSKGLYVMRVRIIIFLCCFIVNANAAELSTAERMLITMGIDQILDQAKAAQEKEAREQVDLMMHQLSGVFEKIPEDEIAKITAIFQTMMQDISNSWTTEEALRIYSQTWTTNYTEDELQSVIKRYERPEAMKELQTALEASAGLNAYFSASFRQASETAMAKAIPEMQLIIKESLSKRKQGTKK